MKTRKFNLGKGLLIVLVSFTFSLYCNGATKGHETSGNTSNTNSIINKSNTAEANPKNSIEPLSETIQGWMENGDYWKSESTNENSSNKLAEEMEEWMTNGKYWEPAVESPKTNDQLRGTLMGWMQSDSYWSKEK